MEVNQDTEFQMVYNSLKSKFGEAMERIDVANTMSYSISTLDNHQRQGLAPRCKRVGGKKRPRVIYPTIEVAKFLTSDLVEVI